MAYQKELFKLLNFLYPFVLFPMIIRDVHKHPLKKKITRKKKIDMRVPIHIYLPLKFINN